MLRFFSFWFFLEAFHIGGSFENVLLVMSVQAISTLLPLTPGGAGAQQALLVATLRGPGPIAVLTYSVGQQIAIAVWTGDPRLPRARVRLPDHRLAQPDPRRRRGGADKREKPTATELGLSPRSARAPASARAAPRPRGKREVVAAREGLERDQRRDVLEVQADPGRRLDLGGPGGAASSRSQPKRRPVEPVGDPDRAAGAAQVLDRGEHGDPPFETRSAPARGPGAAQLAWRQRRKSTGSRPPDPRARAAGASGRTSLPSGKP